MSERESGPDQPPGTHVCRRCGRVLDFSTVDGFIHTVGDVGMDHDPEPVPMDEAELVAGRCDFCYVDFPGWEIPARDFEVASGHMSQGNWSACEVCADLVGRDQWSVLLRRAKDSWEDRHGVMPGSVEAGLRAMYRKLRKHVSGAPHPIR